LTEEKSALDEAGLEPEVFVRSLSNIKTEEIEKEGMKYMRND
jgi:hypothetical protein